MTIRPHIGTLREKPLHAALKRWYFEPGDRVEQPMNGYVIDLVRGDLLIEIQTRGFSSMKKKLAALLETHSVHVVHPVAIEKWIVKVDEAGAVLSRRKSPKRGTVLDVFGELVSFPQLIDHPRFSVEVVLVREDEIRSFDANRAWRRKGWVVDERRLIEVADSIVLDSVEALMSLLPVGLSPTFTTADIAESLRASRRIAQQMTYCLRNVGAIEMVDKDGNALVYSLT
ncbi:MAG: hypothetical protein HKN07_09405 [Acidimicrobiia bacterium]|nr:hypothetical protein [Acidimicrobiia bacterium]NNF64464.1 hypothetical protein [Acidimicrobiia bacterium]